MNRLLLLMCIAVTMPVSAQTIVIADATVHTAGPAGTLNNASILVRDGQIVGVGENIDIPDDAEVIDASGMIVTPGLVSPLGQIGLSEVGAVSGTNDGIQRGQRYTASFDLSTAFNQRSTLVSIARIDGITRAGITPTSGGVDDQGNASQVLSGLGSVVMLTGEDDFLLRHGSMIVASLGESGSNLAAGSRASAVQRIRAALDDAVAFGQDRTAFEGADARDASVSIDDLEALQALFDGTATLIVHANRASDLSMVATLATEYGISAAIAGAAEGWMVADELVAAAIPVILDGTANLPGNFDRLNARLDNADLLADAGVTVSFGAGAQTHNARLLTQSAGIAVAHGLDYGEAIKAITANPAAIVGVSDIVGSIQTGREADLVIWDADPLEQTSYPVAVYIRGVSQSMTSRQTLLRDRYLQTDSSRPPAWRQ